MSPTTENPQYTDELFAVKVPKPMDDMAEAIDPGSRNPLPQTLVRIPAEQQAENSPVSNARDRPRKAE